MPVACSTRRFANSENSKVTIAMILSLINIFEPWTTALVISNAALGAGYSGYSKLGRF
jgi:hypothetical protein